MVLPEAGIAVDLRGVSQRHPGEDGAPPVDALNDVSLRIEPGELVAVVGPSGSGKSSVLHIMGALAVPTSGTVLVGRDDLATLSRRRLAQLRAEAVGFVFQAFNLLGHLTVTQNVAVPSSLTTRRRSGTATEARVAELLDLVGLTDKADQRPARLSGGEQQRVAVARALVNEPQLVLADEPTGNLDSRAGRQIVDLLHACHEAGRTVVLVTHDMRLASQAQRIVHLRDGRITHESRPHSTRQTRRAGSTQRIDPARLRVG